MFKLPVVCFFGACSFHPFLFSFSTLKLWDAAAGDDDDDDDPIFTRRSEKMIGVGEVQGCRGWLTVEVVIRNV